MTKFELHAVSGSTSFELGDVYFFQWGSNILNLCFQKSSEKLHIFSEGYRRYLSLCLTSSVSQLVSQLVS